MLMPALISRMLTLFALVLMPFGMSAASAGPIHHTPAAAAQHCDEQGSQPVQAPDAMDCALTCSMLVGAQLGAVEPLPPVRLPTARLPAERGAGLHPDTATPPPKLA